ncbi:peroxide stress protein YaaA [Pontibacter sp. G13]|uniref:peroxide stress protein YaaA n=1 Tax=Pontibacter sp. G13 TaxID=3074898 RepID=UPI00288934E8|nr:peroxide stress protein YaaA [Pontibacter sp. G13]WNJ17423.1 peroxide stress protein YaaA [Pontibacter sp. G13]
MLIVISPAKKLDFSEETRFTDRYTQPTLLDHSVELAGILSEMSAPEIGELMHLSENLSQLNHDRYQQFAPPFTPQNAKQALLSFKGDVFLSFDLASYADSEFEYAQSHLRILSGLYGLLKPLDLIQPYRLEMKTKLKNARGKDLYSFWGSIIRNELHSALSESGSDTLINLASNEYFKSVGAKEFSGKIITPVFKDEKNGVFKTIFLYAKQARGAMCDYAIQEKVSDPEQLKDFKGMGYAFQPAESTDTQWVFTRSSVK